MRRKFTYLKYITAALVIILLYKANRRQQESNTHGILGSEHIDLNDGQFGRLRLDKLSLVNASFRDWNDESMVLYTREPRCPEKAVFNKNSGPLMDMLSQSELWFWMRDRIKNSWQEWTNTIDRMRATENWPMNNFKRKHILIMPGMLTVTEYAQPKTIAAGGPLGELLQWSDLIAGLYLLGHNITLEENIEATKLRLEALAERTSAACMGYDLIFTDSYGVNLLGGITREKFRCRLRVLDVYGTHAAYNDPEYKKSHNINAKSGGLGLHLKQFYTFYPQTPDNSFLGFAVKGSNNQDSAPKENIAVIYGKDSRYARGHVHFLSVLSKYMDIHYTMSEDLNLDTHGKFVNVGVLKAENYGELLDKAKVFIGLGDPVEGTGVMEALAHGCVFINPKFSRDGQAMFVTQGKPTNRLVTSQIPYLEQYIGPPHVYTVDIDNLTEVVLLMQEIMDRKDFQRFIPEEFTMAGYLTRLALYVEHQDLCTPNQNTTWPPLSLVQTILGEDGRSCEDVCHKHGYVCEPAYFKHINEKRHFQRLHGKCVVFVSGPEVIYPAVDTSTSTDVCWLQADVRLFSCAGELNDRRRICPCRSYRRNQVALWDQ